MNSAAYFDAPMAQRLVDGVTSRLAHNINIMSRDGRILGSADRTRLGSLHPGALAAIAQNAPVFTEDDHELGTRTGINLPLTVDGQVVGAVGVTGDPDSVVQLGEIVTLTIELLVREERSRHERRGRDKRLADVVRSLITGSLTEAEFAVALELAGVSLSPPWDLSVVIDLDPDASPLTDHTALLRRLQRTPDVLAIYTYGAIWILAASVDDVRHARVRPEPPRGFRTIRGPVRSSVPELIVDAQRLRFALEYPANVPVHTSVDVATLDVEIAVAQQSNALSREVATRVVSRLSVPLQNTARAFLDSDMSAKDAAALLHIHRNTLVQRLDRIEALTGLNIRRFGHAVRMRVALLADGAAGGTGPEQCECARYTSDGQESQNCGQSTYFCCHGWSLS